MLYTYYYEGSQLQRLTVGDSLTMDFFYDQSGRPYAMKYNNLKIYYVLNQQGDVVQIVGAAGKPYGTYTYDAWGNILSQTNNAVINANPLRYRGYVYDAESKLYYCQSRYYDPATGRFINADALISTGQGLLGNNMFAYCLNNPVNRSDSLGYISYDNVDEDPNGDRSPLNDVARIGTGSISRGTFRVRLIKLTGQAPANSDAHHTFPYSMASKFSQLGIDVNNAQYGSWVDSSTHRQYSYDYNQWWVAFFNIPGVTQGDAFALVEFLAALFGFDLHY